MQVIIYENLDQTVSIVYPATEYLDQLELIAQKDVPAGVSWRIIDTSELPPQETRQRWRWTVTGPLQVADPPAPEIPTITFAQLLIGLVAEGWITKEEGEAWLQGILPVAVQLLIETLPESMRFAAIARASRPSVVIRSDPLVNALGILQQKTAEELDGFFITYSQV